MLADATPMPTLATKDLAAARAFYEGVLGLPVQAEREGQSVVYRSGQGALLVYNSAFAGTNQGTAAGWMVADFDGEVARLRAAGVEFDTFELPGATWDNGVASDPERGMRNVWFRDPDGNILTVGQPPPDLQ